MAKNMTEILSMSLVPGWLQTVKFGDVFIETGTGEGGGIWEAARAGFREIHSIDVETKPEIKIPGVAINQYTCRSDYGLMQLLGEINEPFTVFLDAHKRGEKSPLRDELFQLEWCGDQHRILIDDLRRYRDGTWGPSIPELLAILGKNYSIAYADNLVALNDILIATRQ